MKIAIDGPAGAGKSTVAKRLARELGFTYIDTGAMYRALTWKALQTGVDLNNVRSLSHLADTTDIHFEIHTEGQIILCDGQNVTNLIRTPRINDSVSIVAAHPDVRYIMVRNQQQLAHVCSVVMDGRDIGECVLPDADYKFYLTASIEERTHRRLAELEDQGYRVKADKIRQDLLKRDWIDSQRPVGALKILPDSIVVDTSSMTEEQVVQHILKRVREG